MPPCGLLLASSLLTAAEILAGTVQVCKNGERIVALGS